MREPRLTSVECAVSTSPSATAIWNVMCVSMPAAITPYWFAATPNAQSASVKIAPPWHLPLKLRCCRPIVRRIVAVPGPDATNSMAVSRWNGSRSQKPHSVAATSAAVGTGAVVAWAIRKDSPELHAELTAFFEEAGRKERVHEARLAQAIQDTRQIGNSMADAEIKRFQNTLALFRKYGEQYGFDPLMLAAQGYQLSRLDQRTENYHGAVGVMQVMPQIGKTLKVGNIRTVEPNIHAAAKYMDQLMARHFEDADFDDTNRNLFASASYHAGGHNIAAMRAEAERRGLDPNQWFNNVEIVYGEKLGLRTPTYVRNVYKYYVAYKLMMDDPGAAK